MAALQTQIEELKHSIDGLESQRGILGDSVVNPALAALRQQLAALEEQAAAEPVPAEERRLVTILFTDMVGSTARAEKMDPEEWRHLVQSMHAALGSAVTAHGGTIAQYLGDGLLAFFGAREAAEADPENAIRAALDAQAAVADLSSTERVQIRAGIHTGLVVVGELGEESHKEFTASGDAMNLAARLQSAAPPDGILISHDTYRYVRGVFDLTPRPPLTVKGKSEPIQTYLVRRAKPRPFRTVTRGVAGVEAHTVGREAEIRALQSAYLRAYEGRGVVWAQLVGQPGVGKSRLVAELNDWTDLREETYRILRARSFPDDTNQPFALVRRMWFDRFQIAEDAPLRQAESKWVERLKELSGRDDWEEAAHALGLLVGLPFLDSPYIGAMRNDPVQVKGRALVVSREVFQSIRGQGPVVVLLEDLQWTDAASWDYLMDVFLDEGTALQSNGLFILGAGRPEWHPPQRLVELLKGSSLDGHGAAKWGIQVALEPLADEALRQLAEELMQQAVDVPAQVIDLLVERSEGVPYYAEEMVNWFIDNGILDTRTEPWRFFPDKFKGTPFPATLQHLLLTRLGNLPASERAALQRGAIFGRRFWTGGVEALGLPGGAETLGHVQRRGFVQVQPESSFEGDTEWSFQQSLLREVTYESVLKKERAALHKVAADWLERQARQAGRLSEFAGLLGDHCERAGELSAAADWYLLAGKRAMGQGASREAVGFYTQALDLLPPVDRERRWQALLGREEALRILSDVEPRRADITALVELAGLSGSDDRFAEAYFRQAVCLLETGDSAGADRAGREALAAAQRCAEEAIQARALGLIAAANFDIADAAQTTQLADEALLLARRMGNEAVLAQVLHRAAFVCYNLGGLERACILQQEQIEVDHRIGNRNREALGLSNLASAYSCMGLYKPARVALEQAYAISKSLGNRRQEGYTLINFGEICLATGDLRKARQPLEQALQVLAPTQDARAQGFALDDLGFLLLALGDAPGAARRFAESHRLAVGKGMPSLACESTAGLASCAVMQGQPDEARKYALEAWDYLKEHGWKGLDTANRTYRSCAEALSALGDDEHAREVLLAAHCEIMEVAGKFADPARRLSFLENVPDNRALLEMWERIGA